MSQLFTAVYDISSAIEGHPNLRLNLVVDGCNDTVVGNAQLDGERGIAVRGHHVEIDGEQPMQAILLAGTTPVSVTEGQPSAFQLLMVLPTAWKAGQVCYKMSFGQRQARVLEIRDGVAHAVLPALMH